MALDLRPYEPDTGLDIQPVAPLQGPQASPYRGRTMSEEFMRQLGLVGRMGGSIATSTANAVGDAVAGTAEFLGKAGEKIGLPPQQPIGRPSQGTQNAMSRAGLPEAETPIEKGVQFAGGIFGGGFDPFAGAITRGVNSLFNTPANFVNPHMNANQRTTVELNQAGVKMLPGQMEAGVAGKTVQGMGSKEHLEQSMRFSNQTVAQNRAGQATGLPPRNLTDDVINHANEQIYNRTYQPIIDALPVVPRGGTAQRTELEAIVNRYGSGPHGVEIRNRANEALRAMRTPNAIDRIRDLRRDATDAFRQNESTRGIALRQIADSIENQIERSLGTNPGLVQNFRAGRTEIAKNLSLRDSLVDPTTGIVDPTKMFALQQSGARLTDGLDTIAKMGSPVYSNVTRPPLGGENAPVNWGERLYSVGGPTAGGAVGYALTGGNPVGTMLGMAVPPMLRSGARRIAMSDAMQNAMARRLTGQAGPLAGLMDQTMFAAPASFNLAPTLFGGQ